MPAPTIVSAQSLGGGSGATVANLTIPASPAPLPEIAAGQVVAYYVISQTGGQAITIAATNAWSNDAAHQAWNGTTNRTTVYFRTLTAADLGTTIGATFGATQVHDAALIIVRNHGGEDGISQIVKATASTTDTFNSVTPAGPNRFVIYIDGDSYNATSAVTQTYTVPANYVQDVADGGVAGTNLKATIAIGHRQLAGGAGAAETVGSITLGTSSKQGGIVIAVAPTPTIAPRTGSMQYGGRPPRRMQSVGERRGPRDVPAVAAPAGRVPPTKVAFAQAANWQGTTTPISLPSVSWQAGDVVVVLGSTADQTNTLSTPTVAGLTFTANGTAQTASSSCWAHKWVATAGSSGSGAIQVVRVGAGSVQFGAMVEVWRGSDGVGNGAAPAATTGKTVSLVRSQAESAVAALLADWGAGTTAVTWTPAGSSGSLVASNGGGSTYSVVAADWPDQDAAGTTSYGVSAGLAGTQNITKIAIEILGKAGTGSSTSMVPPIIVPDRRPRMASRSNRAERPVPLAGPKPLAMSPARWPVRRPRRATVIGPVGSPADVVTTSAPPAVTSRPRRPLRTRRAELAQPIPAAAAAPTVQDLPPVVVAVRRRLGRLRRAVLLAVPQAADTAVTTGQRRRPRMILPVRRRLAAAPPVEQLPAPWLRRSPRPRPVTRRARAVDVPVVAAVFIPDASPLPGPTRIRVRPVRFRRARAVDVPQAGAVAVTAQALPPSAARIRIRAAAILRRGRAATFPVGQAGAAATAQDLPPVAARVRVRSWVRPRRRPVETVGPVHAAAVQMAPPVLARRVAARITRRVRATVATPAGATPVASAGPTVRRRALPTRPRPRVATPPSQLSAAGPGPLAGRVERAVRRLPWLRRRRTAAPGLFPNTVTPAPTNPYGVVDASAVPVGTVSPSAAAVGTLSASAGTLATVEPTVRLAGGPG